MDNNNNLNNGMNQPIDGMQQVNSYGQPMDGSQQNFQQFTPQGEYQPNQFGQPPAANMGDANGNAKKPKKPLGKGAIAGIIGGGVAIVAAIVCGIIFIPKLFKTDKEVVLDALKNTFSASDSADDYYEETFGISDISSKITEDGLDYGVKLSLDSISGIEDFNGLSVNLDTNIDQNAKQGEGSVVVNYDGTDIFALESYTDNDNIYVSLSDIIEGYITLPCDGTLEALAGSALGEALEISDSGITGDIKLFPDDAGEGAQTSTQINGELISAIETVWDNTVFKKEGSTKIDVNGEVVNAKEYTVTLGEEDLETVLTELINAVMTEYQNMEDAGIDEEDVQSYIEQAKQLVPTIISSDFVLNVYIADDKVVKLTSAESTNIMGVKLSYDFYMDINDDLSCVFEVGAVGQTAGISCDIKDFRNEPNGDIKLYVSDKEIDLSIESENKSSDSALGFNGSLTCSYDDDRIFKISMDYVLNKSDNTFDGTVGIYGEDDEEDAVELTFNGQYVDIVRGEGYGCQMDKISLSMEGNELLTMSSKVDIGTTPQVKGIDSSLPIYDIAAMSESDLQEAIDSNDYLSEKWIETIENSGLLDVLGLYSSSATEYLYEDTDEDESIDYSYDTDTDFSSHSFTCSDGTTVQVKAAPDGFDCTDSGSDHVYFEDDDYETIYYSFVNDNDLESLTEEDVSFYDTYFSDYVTNMQTGLTTEVDGEEITYSKIEMNMYDTETVDYFVYRQLSDGTIIKVEVEIYPEDKTLTEDDILGLTGDSYISIQ